MNTKLSGAMGEAYIADLLRKKKYAITAMNYHSRFGEIDIIASRRKSLVFVEVKLRKKGGVTRAADAVGASKQDKLRATAGLWLAQNSEYANYNISFAVAEVYVSSDGKVEDFNIIENAF